MWQFLWQQMLSKDKRYTIVLCFMSAQCKAYSASLMLRHRIKRDFFCLHLISACLEIQSYCRIYFLTSKNIDLNLSFLLTMMSIYVIRIIFISVVVFNFNVNNIRSFAVLLKQQGKKGLNGTRTLRCPVQAGILQTFLLVTQKQNCKDH